MHLKPCNCSTTTFVREPRPGWMRVLLPALRNWSCSTCGHQFAASKAAVLVWQAERTPGPAPFMPDMSQPLMVRKVPIQGPAPTPTPTP